MMRGTRRSVVVLRAVAGAAVAAAMMGFAFASCSGGDEGECPAETMPCCCDWSLVVAPECRGGEWTCPDGYTAYSGFECGPTIYDGVCAEATAAPRSLRDTGPR